MTILTTNRDSSKQHHASFGLALVCCGFVASAVGLRAIVSRRQTASNHLSYLKDEVEDYDANDNARLDMKGNAKAEREVQKKQRLMERALSINNNDPTSTIRRWTPGSIPPKNFRTTKWLRTDLSAPLLPSAEYSLDEEKYRIALVCGDRRTVLTLGELQSLGMRKYDKVDWHCVTGWSFLGLTLYGVPVHRLLAVLGPDIVAGSSSSQWRWMYQISADGYTCPVFREDVLRDDVFFAVREENGALMSFEHGGPRMVMPSLWGWKSSKYLTEIRLIKDYVPGFWERLMCHERGRIYDENGVYLEERWNTTATRTGLHDLATGMVNMYHFVFGPRVYALTMSVGGWLVGLLAKPLLLSSTAKDLPR